MPVYTQLAEDTFHRADENPLTASKWTLTTGGVSSPIQLKNHQAVGTSISQTNSMYYSGAAIPNNQYVEVTVGALSPGTVLEFEARASLDSATGYISQVSPIDFLIVGGGIFGDFLVSTRTGDKFRLECLGTKISAYYNGILMLSQNRCHICFRYRRHKYNRLSYWERWIFSFHCRRF